MTHKEILQRIKKCSEDKKTFIVSQRYVQIVLLTLIKDSENIEDVVWEVEALTSCKTTEIAQRRVKEYGKEIRAQGGYSVSEYDRLVEKHEVSKKVWKIHIELNHLREDLDVLKRVYARTDTFSHYLAIAEEKMNDRVCYYTKKLSDIIEENKNVSK